MKSNQIKWMHIVLLILIISALEATAATIKSAKSGYWFNTGTWVGGVVPSETDDVIISDKHTIDVFGAQTTHFSVNLCQNLTVQPLGVLTIGHNHVSNNSTINITGNLLCDGAIWRGNVTGTSNLNGNNSLIVFQIQNVDLTVSGKGYFGPGSIQYNVTGQDKNIVISHQYVVTDLDFYVNADFPVKMEIDRFAYIYVRRNLGLTGRVYAEMKATTSVQCFLYGTLVAGNVWLLNPQGSTSPTVLEIKPQASLTANMFNKNSSDKNSVGGFKVIVHENGTLRSAYGGNDPKVLASNDNNLQIIENSGARVVGWHTIKFPTASGLKSKIDPFLPKNSTSIESDFSDVYSASHIAGWYHFTDKPYLKEGKDALKELGPTHIKLAFSVQKWKPFENYPFNHNWGDYPKLIDYAKDPYWVEVFSDSHYRKYTFWTTPRNLNNGQYKSGAHLNLKLFWEEEEEFYELAKYLLQTYPNKEFVFQNWEGDWMLRGSGVNWENDPSLIPSNLEIMLEGMRRMFQARQRGVERAREEVGGSARVMHAIEINKLYTYKNNKYQTMMELNVPCLVSEVVTHCRLDLVSWSAYDGIFGNVKEDFPIGLGKGIEVLETYLNPTGYCQKLPVQIGEIGFNENPKYRPSGLTDSLLKDYYERLAGLARYKNIQAFFLWNLYCSGQQGITLEKGVEYDPVWLTPYLDGKWVIKPDGTKGFSGQKFLSFKNKLEPYTGISKLKPDMDIVFSNGILTIPDELMNLTFEIIDLNGIVLKKFNRIPTLNLNDFGKGVYILSNSDRIFKANKIIIH